jgi:5-methylthioadenosine/S-adenosylhomocysteine deaminase
MNEYADTLIIHAHLFTMQGTGVGYIEDGAVAIRGDQIVAVGKTGVLDGRFQPHTIIDASGHAVLPGLIDAHMHTPLAILRGVAQDVAHWMQTALSPYTRHLTDAGRLAGTQLNVLEGLKAGTTTFSDNYPPFAGWGAIFEQFGVRAVLSPGFNALPPGKMAEWKVGALYPFDVAAGREAMSRAVAFAKEWDGAANGRITAMLGVHGADMMPQKLLLEAKAVGQREGWMLHMHTAQGDRETEQISKRYGKRSVAFLDEIGYLDEQLLAIHLTDASEEEAALVAQRGAKMIVCSGSIGIIDGIVPPAAAFKRAGGPVGLGSDQACGNNCNNIFNEMKLTALFNKIRYSDPTMMPAWEVLRMATIEGARALGLEDKIGSLAVGKQADLILVDLMEPNLSPILQDPIRNIVPNLVYAGSGHEVKTVLVAGKVLLENGRLQTIDETAVVAAAQEQANLLAQKVAADPAHKNLALLAAMKAGQL